MGDWTEGRVAAAARLLAGVSVIVLQAAACSSNAGAPTAPSPAATQTQPGFLQRNVREGRAVAAAQQRQLRLARSKIRHVVFLVKENRTFDTMFGRFPGADGSTTGTTCDGRTVPLTRARDRQPDITHSFFAGLIAVDGGRMDCFDRIEGGQDLQGYVQFARDQVPNYWTYAQRFELADHFFSSVYGPTGIEHLWTIAGQSGNLIEQERQGQYGTGPPREFCDDRQERAYGFRDLNPKQADAAYRYEEDPNIPAFATYLKEYWPCLSIPTLPDQLEQAGISWKYYRGDNEWVDPLREVKQDRFGPEWGKRVPSPHSSPTFATDRSRPSPGSSHRSRCPITRRTASVRVRTGRSERSTP